MRNKSFVRSSCCFVILFVTVLFLSGCDYGIDCAGVTARAIDIHTGHDWEPCADLTSWRDDFESYELGRFPSDHWTPSGNGGASGNYVDDSQASSGSQSLRLEARSYSGCWQALAFRPLEAHEKFAINLSVYNSGTGGRGCHDNFAKVRLTGAPDWRADSLMLLRFGLDGLIRPGPSQHSLGSYERRRWYRVEIQVQQLENAKVQISYWVNGQPVGTFEQEKGLQRELYLGFSSGDSVVWFDDVEVLQLVQ